jgi:predicted RNA-binding Zn-ribbon protein involved in translation (DUF1610 family)
MSKLKILFTDIETAPIEAYTWGIWQQNISLNQIIKPTYVLCYAAKWLGNKSVMYDGLNKHSGKDASKKMLQSIHKLLDEADIVCTYNGASFDIPHLNREFLKHGMLPPSPYTQVDLLKVVKNQFKLPSNKLDYIAQYIGIGSKQSHEGFGLWVKCMQGDKAAWKTMELYNKKDVTLLEDLYHKLLPWIQKHPARSTSDESCPVCGGNHLQKRGTATNKTGTYQRYQCQDCGSWSSGEVITKHKRKYKQL